MRANFAAALAVTLGFEGGYSNDPRDPGNWTGGKTGKGALKGTNRGISAASYPNLDIKNLSPGQTQEIYRRDYWDKVSGDKLAAGVDLVTFDAGVQSGPSRALNWLMASIGGPDHETVKKICAKRLGFFQTLAIWKTYKNGLVRRVSSVEAKGVAWALAAGGKPAPAVKAKLENEQASAKSQANKNTAGAGMTGGGTTAGGGDALLNPQHADQVAGWILGGLLAAGAVVAAVLVARAIIHHLRAAAYAAEAEAMGAI